MADGCRNNTTCSLSRPLSGLQLTVYTGWDWALLKISENMTHPQKRKCITYYNAAGWASSHSHRQHASRKIGENISFLRYVTEQTDIAIPHAKFVHIVFDIMLAGRCRHTGVDKGGPGAQPPPNGRAKKELTLCLHLKDDISVTKNCTPNSRP